METNYLERSIAFIRSIGIPVTYQKVTEETFLPGILIDQGGLLIDPERLKYPGDVLHEAGHIAVVPAAERRMLTGDAIAHRPERASEEMMAIAWSYAACKHLDIDPRFVFHEEGYQQGGHHMAEQFEQGSLLGVPMLQWVGLSAEPWQAQKLNRQAFPVMEQWLRE